MKVIVRTLLTQELEVPEGWDRYDVYDFLAENQSIIDVGVVEETVEQLGEECFDE